jgi:signal recognition particle subunit SRP54
MLDQLSEKLSDAVRALKGKNKISEDNITDALKLVKTALLEADVHFKVVKDFTESVKQKALGTQVTKGVQPGQQFIKIVHDELTLLMGEKHEELSLKAPAPVVILIVGLNGAGKTTFTGKLGLHLRQKYQKNVLLVPCDTFRPAAKEQLRVHAQNLAMDFFDADLSQGPVKITEAALSYARTHRHDVVVIDTAGRLQVDESLMHELAQVRQASGAHEVLMVADAMTGQEAVNVAKVFHEKVQLTGLVLSKMDSDARGGAALSIKALTGLPIKFISTGEKLKDLEAFHPDRLAGRLLDMGDVLTLVEKAEEAINPDDMNGLMKNLEKGRFTFSDFVKQMEAMNRLGSMGGLLRMIPGMGGMMKNLGDLSQAEVELKKVKVLIQSMTKVEREKTELMKEPSRIARVARGSGRSESDVKEFVQKFEQMQKMMVGMMGMMKTGMMPNMPGMGPVKGFRQAPKGQTPFPGQEESTKSAKKSPFGKKYF